MENQNQQISREELGGDRAGQFTDADLARYNSASRVDVGALSAEYSPVAAAASQTQILPRTPLKSLLIRGSFVLAAVVLLGAAVIVALGTANRRKAELEANKSVANAYSTVRLPLDTLVTEGQDVAFKNKGSIIINGPLKLNEGLIVIPTLQPSSPIAGQFYLDQTTKVLAYYNGTEFVNLGDKGPTVETIGGAVGQVTLAGGLSIVNNQITNTGVLSLGGQTGDITVGDGLAMVGNIVQNTGVLSIVSGSPTLTVDDDGSGNITLTTSPAGTGTVTSGGGTIGRIPLFTGAQNIEDSLISQSGLNVTVNGDLSVVTGGLSLSNALTVSNGGTGATSLAANGVIVGAGTGALSSVTAGGVGLCLLSTAGAPNFAACPSASGVTSLNGLNGGLTIANASAGGSTITIDDATTASKGIASFNATNFSVAGGIVNTIQNINSGATPTFAGVNTNTITPSGVFTLGATGQAATLQGSTTSITSTGAGNNIILNSANTIELQDNTNVTGNFDISGTLAVGTADAFQVNATGDVTTSGNGVIQGGNVTIGTNSQVGTLILNDGSSNTGSLRTAALAQNTVYTLPDPGGAAATICLTTGNCSGVGGGVTTLGGSTNSLAKFSAAQTIADSTITDNGTTVTTTVDVVIQGGDLTLGVPSTQTGTVNFAHSGSAFLGSIVQGALTGNRTYTLPDANGTLCLSSGNCSGAGSTNTLQAAYDAGNSVATTDARDLAITLANSVTTDANFTITIADDSTSTVSIARANGAGTNNPAQLLILDNQDATQAVSNGIVIQSAGGTIVDALDLTDAELVNALNVGDNIVLGTTATIDFSNFDVAGNGNITSAGDVAVNGGDLTSSGALNITPGGLLTIGATGQQLIMQGNASTQITATGGGFTTTVGFTGSPTASVTYNFDRAATAGPYTICSTAGNCAGVGGGVTTAGGSTNTIAMFTGSQAIGDSLLSQSGSVVTVNGDLNLTAGHQFQINSTQISSANLSNDANLAKLAGSQTFTGNSNVFKNGSNSTGAFSVQNAAGNGVLTIDTTGGQAVLGLGGTLDGKLVFHNMSNGNKVTVLPGAPTTDRTLTLPDADGIICTDSGNCAGVGSTLQTAYNFSVGGTTPKIKLNSTLNGVDIQDADTTIGANLFNVRASNGAGLGAVLLGVGNTGAVTMQNSANSTTALRLLTQGGTTVLTGDTTNGQIILGQSSTLDGKLVFNNATNGNQVLLTTAAVSGPQTITLPNATGTVCLTSGNCAGVGGTGDILQNGNSFATTMTLGTNDDNDLVLERFNIPKVTISAGAVTLATDSDLLLQGMNSYISNPRNGLRSEAFGLNATTNNAADDALSVGYNTLSATGSVALGSSASANTASSIAIGNNAKTDSDSEAIALGYNASTGAAHSIAIGTDAATTAANQMVIGAGNSNHINQVIIGNGVTHGTPIGFTLQGTSGNGTDIAGASTTIAAGQGTGNALGGNIVFQSSVAGASGAGLNGLTTLGTLSTTSFTLGTNLDLTLQGATAYISNAQGFTRSESFGNLARFNTGGDDAVAIGYNARAGLQSVVIGSGNDNPANNSITIGYGISNSAAGAIAIGSQAGISGTDNNVILIGTQATTNGATGNDSIALGFGATITAANQMVIGSNAGTTHHISNVFVGSGVTDTTPDDVTIQGTGGSGANVQGADVTIASGRGTGSATGGDLRFSISAPGGSGSSLNSLSQVFGISGATGGAIFQNAVDSSVAFQIQNSASSALLTANTLTRTGGVAGNLLKVGDSTGTDTDTTILQLDGTTANPTTNLASLNGGLFYNSTTHKISLIENGTVKIICNTTDLGCGTGTVTLQNAYTNSAGAAPSILTTSANKAVTIQTANSGGISAGNELFGVRASQAGDTIGNSLFTVNSTGVGINISGTGNPATTADLSFGEGANRTINVLGRATNAAGRSLTIQGGNAGAGASPFAGGGLILKGGAAAGTGNEDGGTVTINGGAPVGIGESGQVIVQAITKDRLDFFQVRNVAGTPLLNVNSTNGKISLGTGSVTAQSFNILFEGSVAGERSIGVDDNATGDGSDFRLQAGTSTGANGNGGSVVLAAGNKNGSGTAGGVTVKNIADTTNSFRIQNAAGSETMLTADTTARSGSGGNLIKIGNSTGTDTATTILQLDGTTADPTTNLAALNGGLFYNSTTNKISLIENGTVKIICNTTDLGCGTGTVTLKNAYDNGNTIAMTTGNNITITSPDVATDPSFIFNAQCTTCSASGGRFAVQNGGTDVFVVSPNSTGLTLGSSTLNTPVAITSGTGAISIGTGAQARTIDIGTGGAVQGLTLGSTNTTSTTTIQGGNGSGAVSVQAATSGTISIGTTNSNVITVGSTTATNNITIGQSTASQTIAIGSGTTAAGNTLTVNIATSATSTGKAVVTIGNTNDGSSLALNSGTGNVTVNTSSTSTTAFAVLNASSVPLFNIDTSNSRVYIGNPTGDTTGALLVLDAKTDYTNGSNSNSEPSGVAGAMYYNSGLGQFRCYEANYWRDCVESARTAYHYINDLTGTSSDAVADFVTGGGGGSTSGVTGEAGHPGIITIDADSLNSWAWIVPRSPGTEIIRFGNGDYWRAETVMRIATSDGGLSNGTQRFTFRTGFVDDASANSGDGTDGCYFRYTDNVNSGKFQGVCRNNATESTCDSTTTVVVDTWYRLTVAVNAAGNSVDFQINGVSKCQVTTNIPTASTRTTNWGTAIWKNLGSTARSAQVDYFEVMGQMGTSR